MSKGIAVLGSTGSIGTQTLKIIEQFPDAYHVVALSAGKNVGLLREQIHKFQPHFVSVVNEKELFSLRDEFPKVEFVPGEEGLAKAVGLPSVQVVVMGIVGFAALKPTWAAVRCGKTVALANKEALVVAGSLLKQEIKQSGALCIPVDSEHNALHQLLRGVDRGQVRSLVLTASGGPLLRRPDLPLEEVTPAIATAHPNWKMGPKISVDSATLMNKGLEMIEAHFLFDIAPDQIEIWIHPQSIVHGAIWLNDNTCFAQLSRPDMRASIAYALAFPDRLQGVIPKLTLRELSTLEFHEPDEKRFPALEIARSALKAGPSALVALNAANEVAVLSYLAGQILFNQIATVILAVLDQHQTAPLSSLDEVIALDAEVREHTNEIVEKWCQSPAGPKR